MLRLRFITPLAAPLRHTLLVSLLALAPQMIIAQTQTTSPATRQALAYDFLTVTTFETGFKAVSKMLIAPAFQGKTEVQLEDFGGLSNNSNLAKLQRNAQLINQQLTDLTTAGWELFQVYPMNYGDNLPTTTRYLFRKVRS